MVPLGGGSSSSSSSDDEDGVAMSLFDFEPSSGDEVSAKEYGVRTFWDELFKQSPHYNSLNDIVQADGLTGQLQDAGHNNGGLLYVSALSSHNGAGYRLIGSVNEQPGSEPVYWMPWKKGRTVYAQRNWYENSKCRFFMTTQFSGCQFVITHNQVLHIAADADGAPDDATGSSARAAARTRVIGDAHHRRLSQSMAGSQRKYGYAFDGPKPEDEEAPRKLFKHALVFGMREPNGTWTYKAFTYTLSSHGVWQTLNVPEG